MAKHTPGPWYQDKWGDIYPVGGREKIQVVGVALSCGSGGDQRNKAEANARLIAAAPDLLAACERALHSFVTNEGPITALDAIALRDAIANANGEPTQ